MTTRVTVAACPEESVMVIEVDGSLNTKRSYIAAGETRDFYVWGDGVIEVYERRRFLLA